MRIHEIPRCCSVSTCGGLLVVGVLACLGCQRDAVKAEPVTQTPAVTSTETQRDNGIQDNDPDVLQQAADLLNQTKDASGNFSVKKAADWMKDQLDDAAEAGGSTAEGSLDWANEMYESLKKQGLTTAGSTTEWVAQDWRKMGVWEYKVVQLEDLSPIEIEKKLNELGKQRWECFHVMPLAGTQMYFKRPARSYLKNIPLKDMLRLIPMLDGSGE